MKKKIYDRESKLLITVNAFSIYSLRMLYSVLYDVKSALFLFAKRKQNNNKNYEHQVIIPRFGYNVDSKNDHTKFLSVF